MENLKKKLTIATVTVVIAFLVIIVSAVFLLQSKNYNNPKNQPGVEDISQKPNSISSTFFYNGENSKDALTLLKQKANITQDSSGMVASINGRSADSAKHEYWAFYVNGKLANVGSADYKTKNSDGIEWKIEKY